MFHLLSCLSLSYATGVTDQASSCYDFQMRLLGPFPTDPGPASTLVLACMTGANISLNSKFATPLTPGISFQIQLHPAICLLPRRTSPPGIKLRSRRWSSDDSRSIIRGRRVYMEVLISPRRMIRLCLLRGASPQPIPKPLQSISLSFPADSFWSPQRRETLALRQRHLLPHHHSADDLY